MSSHALIACPSCNCHANQAEVTCPHCGQALRRANGSIERTAASVMLGLAVSIAAPATLTGCDGETADDTTSSMNVSSSTYPDVVSAYGISVTGGLSVTTGEDGVGGPGGVGGVGGAGGAGGK